MKSEREYRESRRFFAPLRKYWYISVGIRATFALCHATFTVFPDESLLEVTSLCFRHERNMNPDSKTMNRSSPRQIFDFSDFSPFYAVKFWFWTETQTLRWQSSDWKASFTNKNIHPVPILANKPNGRLWIFAYFTSFSQKVKISKKKRQIVLCQKTVGKEENEHENSSNHWGQFLICT